MTLLLLFLILIGCLLGFLVGEHLGFKRGVHNEGLRHRDIQKEIDELEKKTRDLDLGYKPETPSPSTL